MKNSKAKIKNWSDINKLVDYFTTLTNRINASASHYAKEQPQVVYTAPDISKKTEACMYLYQVSDKIQ